MRWLDGITDSVDMRLSKLWEMEGQGSLACCSPWGHKESDRTEQLNNNNHEIQGHVSCSRSATFNLHGGRVLPSSSPHSKVDCVVSAL